jgi:peroxiredoxin
LPGFVQNYDKLKSFGVDTIACVSVNDVFVMDAWGKQQGVKDKIVSICSKFMNSIIL